MASMNGNENGNPLTPDKVICDGLKVIREEGKAADSSRIAKETLKRSKKTIKGYKICCLKRAQESYELYNSMMTCVVIETSKKTEIIKTKVDELIVKDSEIEKLIKESSKLISELNVKMGEANTAACDMKTCVENKFLTKLKKLPDKKRTDLDRDFEVLFYKIMDKNKTVNDKVVNAFESVVSIAGLQTFVNTESLKENTDALTTAMETLKGCIETYIGSTKGEVTTIREELNIVVAELAQLKCDEKMEGAKVDGLNLIQTFICKAECDDECLDVCKEFNACKEEPDPDEEDCGSDHEHKGQQTKDQN